MQILKTKIPDVWLISPKVYQDPRGYFFESFRADKLAQHGFDKTFVQDNQSKSEKGVLRGMHYQIEPEAMDKLVSVVRGEIFDVAVDIRKQSPTFGQWVGHELSSDNKKQMLIPVGFAHGFLVLSDNAVVQYKCTSYYSPQHERSIAWNDPNIKITWPLKEVILSDKDKKTPRLNQQKDLF